MFSGVFVWQVHGLNPQLRNVLDSNPQLKEGMQNPEFTREVHNILLLIYGNFTLDQTLLRTQCERFMVLPWGVILVFRQWIVYQLFIFSRKPKRITVGSLIEWMQDHKLNGWKRKRSTSYWPLLLWLEVSQCTAQKQSHLTHYFTFELCHLNILCKVDKKIKVLFSQKMRRGHKKNFSKKNKYLKYHLSNIMPANY